ncbi:MAG: NTP transferase domain-containing protein, partial [Candidatus Methanofastidiosa archaeon]|nr:NTP transferase domain-containing protein [Candidatus Methanofastidiosa archaeon]
MKALIMAGGKGTRMQIDEEKPLIALNGSTLIDRMFSIAKGTLGLGEIYLAVSGNTPKTERYLSDKKEQGFRLVRTKGKSYHEDLREAITHEMLFEPVMVLPADMPFIRPEFLDYAIERYIACERMALSVF